MRTNLATRELALATPNVREVSFNGTTWTAYEPGDILPARPSDNGVPQEVTMRQARLALQGASKLSAVQAAINLMAEPAKTQTQIWWDYSSTVVRSQPLVAQLGTAIGLTPTGIDDLFKTAATL
jgi:hypothetical protein